MWHSDRTNVLGLLWLSLKRKTLKEKELKVYRNTMYGKACSKNFQKNSLPWPSESGEANDLLFCTYLDLVCVNTHFMLLFYNKLNYSALHST